MGVEPQPEEAPAVVEAVSVEPATVALPPEANRSSPGQLSLAGGWGQGFGEQTEAAPWKVLPAAQPTEIVEEHVPSMAQQAPNRAAQGSGEQTVFAPW